MYEEAKFIVTGSSFLNSAEPWQNSLLEEFSSLNFFPLVFHEFLVAKGERLAKIYEDRNEHVGEFLLEGKFSAVKDVFLKEFFPLFNEYVTFGGYPAVIKAEELETKRMILKNIYDTYSCG